MDPMGFWKVITGISVFYVFFFGGGAGILGVFYVVQRVF